MTYNEYFLKNAHIGDTLAIIDQGILKLLVFLSIWAIFNKRITLKIIGLSITLIPIAEITGVFDLFFWAFNDTVLSLLGRKTNNPQISIVLPLIITTISLFVSIFRRWDVQKVFLIIISIISLGVVFVYHLVFVQGILKSDIQDEFHRMESILKLSDPDLRRYVCHENGYICFSGTSTDLFFQVEVISDKINAEISKGEDVYLKDYNLLSLTKDDKVFSYAFLMANNNWELILSVERVEKIHNAVKTYFYILANITHFIWIFLGSLLLCYHNNKIYRRVTTNN